jgi:hypothetical protein
MVQLPGADLSPGHVAPVDEPRGDQENVAGCGQQQQFVRTTMAPLQLSQFPNQLPLRQQST